VRELLLMTVMTLGMLDLVTGMRVVPVVVWSGMLLAASLALAVRRRGRIGDDQEARRRLHTTLSGVLMAGLMLVMATGHRHTIQQPGHHHAVTGPLLVAALAMGSAFLAASAARGAFRGDSMTRLGYGSLAASVALTALAAFV
jgi:hypothetical protein